MLETFYLHTGKKRKRKKKFKLPDIFKMSETDNAKRIFEISSAEKFDEHEFKIFQSNALKYKKHKLPDILKMSEMDNAKRIFEISSSEKFDEHEFKIFQSYALRYKNNTSKTE